MSDSPSNRDSSVSCSTLADILSELADQFADGHEVDLSQYTELYPELASQLREAYELLRRVYELRKNLTAELVESEVFREPLGDFQILRELGRGGMGIVYEARQLSLGRHVALKILPFASLLDPRHIERFRNEACAAAMLKHDNIVSVYSVGCERGIHHYAMQLIEGETLAVLVRRWQVERSEAVKQSRGIGFQPVETAGKHDRLEAYPTLFHRLAASSDAHRADTSPIANLSTQGSRRPESHYRAVARMGMQAAQALEYAHQGGVIHRDIKPSNLIIDPSGKVYVTDFGLARIQSTESVTLSGDIVGTLRYMSPEQLEDHVVDQRTDVYSLGLTLYELVTGQAAHSGSNRQQLMKQIVDEPLKPLRSADRAAPPDLETILAKATAKEANDRYATAGEFAADLQRFVEDKPIQARPAGRVERMWRWYKRSRRMAAMSAAIFVLALAVAGSSVFIAQRETSQRKLAEQTTKEARWQQYLSDMHSAMAAWEDSNVGCTLSLLDRHFPKSDEEDLRGFEWYYLWRKCEKSRPLLSIPHPDVVWTAAFSPDGTLLATGSDAGVLRVWNSSDGALLKSLYGHEGTIRAVIFSPSGKTLATCGSDNSARLWDVDTGRQLHILLGHTDNVERVLFTADGSQLITSSNDLTIRTWDIETGHLTATAPCLGTLAPPLLEDQAWIDPFSRSEKVQLINTRDGRVIQQLQRPELSMSENMGFFGVSPSRQIGITGAQDGGVRFFRLTDGVNLSAGLEHRRAIGHLAVSEDGQWCATGDVSGRVVVWNLDTLRAESVFLGHSNTVVRLAWSSDARRLVSVSNDMTAKVWDRSPAGEKEICRDHSDHTLVQAFHPTGRWLATAAGVKNELFIWDTSTGARVASLSGHEDTIWSMEFSPDGQELATICHDGTLRVWDFDRRTLRREIVVSDWPLRSLAYSRDGTELLTGDQSGLIHVYQSDAGRKQQQLRVSDSPVHSLVFSPDGTALAVDVDGAVMLIDYPAWEPTNKFPKCMPYVETIAFSPDGTMLACAGYASADVVFISLAGDELFRLRHPMGLKGICFSPDGLTLVTCGIDDKLRIWDIQRRVVRSELRGHDFMVDNVKFSPDGNTIASCGGDGTLRWWRAAGRGEPLRRRAEILKAVLPPGRDMESSFKGPEPWLPQPGQWRQGIVPLEARLKVMPHDSMTLYQLAILKLHFEDRAGYEQLIDQWIGEFETSVESARLPPSAERTALACALDSQMSADGIARFLKIFQRTTSTSDSLKRTNFGWVLLARGLAEHRTGDHQTAMATLQQVLSTHHSTPMREAITHLALALAYQSLQQDELARRALAQAKTVIHQYEPWIETRTAETNYPWQDWLACQMLRIEAEKKLEARR